MDDWRSYVGDVLVICGLGIGLATMPLLFGCATATLTIKDPATGMELSYERSSFLRHGTAEMRYRDAEVKVDDKPISPQLAWLTAGLGCIAGAIVGAPAGGVGSVVGCIGGGILGGTAAAVGSDDEPSGGNPGKELGEPDDHTAVLPLSPPAAPAVLPAPEAHRRLAPHRPFTDLPPQHFRLATR